MSCFHCGSRISSMIAPEDLVGKEWAEWYRMTPLGHWRKTQKLWQIYLDLGGSLDPEPDIKVLSSIRAYRSGANQNTNRAPIWPVRADAALVILPKVADKISLAGSLKF